MWQKLLLLIINQSFDEETTITPAFAKFKRWRLSACASSATTLWHQSDAK
jgi:hypothetical protein